MHGRLALHLARNGDTRIRHAIESPLSKVAGSPASPIGNACANWFRKLARALKICRLYKSDNSVVLQSREQVLDGLEKIIAENSGLTMRFTPSEIYVNDEAVVHQLPGGGDDTVQSSGEEQLPFLFYRDGIRGIRIPMDVPREQLEAFFDALKATGAGDLTHDDLVTLLWQANLSHIHVDTVPLEQTIYVSARPGTEAEAVTTEAQKPVWTSVGAEIHANLGQGGGRQGLHRDTFDDWELTDGAVEVPEAYQELLPAMEYSLAHFRAAWEEEDERDWTHDIPTVLRQVLALDPSEESRQAVGRAVVTWLGSALQSASLEEAQRALGLLSEFDPDRSLSDQELAAVLARFDHERLVDYLNEADPEEQARFAALAVSLGKPAVDLTMSVLSKGTDTRSRAAACTALCYQCADDPQLLAPYFADARGEAMVDIIFTLGQIGGAQVADLLRMASRHPEPRVRRQVILALGGVPANLRIPILVEGLDTTDMHLLAATLQILTRERTPQVAQAILSHIAAPEFESRSEDIRWALFTALTEVADDSVVPELAAVLNRGGWFARRTFARSAAARTLQHIGTKKAQEVLTAGLRSPAGAVRRACRDVMKGTDS